MEMGTLGMRFKTDRARDWSSFERSGVNVYAQDFVVRFEEWIRRAQMMIRRKSDWIDEIGQPLVANAYAVEIASAWEKEHYRKPDEKTKKKNSVIAHKAMEGLMLVAKMCATMRQNAPMLSGKIAPSSVRGVWYGDGIVPHDVICNLQQEFEKLEDDCNQNRTNDDNSQVVRLIDPSLYCYVAGVTQFSDGSVEEVPELEKAPLFCDEWPTCDSLEPFHHASKRHHVFGERRQLWRDLYEKNTDRKPSGIYEFRWNSFPELDRAAIEAEFYTEVDHQDESFNLSRCEWLPTDFKFDPENDRCHALGYINNLRERGHAELRGAIERVLARVVPMWDCVLNRADEPRFEPDIRSLDQDDVQSLQSGTWVPFCTQTGAENTTLRAGSTLQVIIKAVNIDLSPESPAFVGTPWQVAGTPNEKIAAAAMYFYHDVNVRESKLEFRCALKEPDEDEGFSDSGKEPDEALNENLGQVRVFDGRCVVFPNRMQYRMKRFRLEDKTRRGQRKVLVMFLVDPSVVRISTAVVPPQQPHSDYVREVKGVLTSRLDDDTAERILERSGAQMSLKDARMFREELVKEHKYVREVVNSLCELECPDFYMS
uniref:DUF4246 domain-containing protein n=1 Tax=Erythrolobus madagascarensis TaxID=708628 RepID=A0A7S0T3L9_9RHOD